MAVDFREFRDPFKLRALLWPDVIFYREQRLMISSVWENYETDVTAGNMLGKDFTAGFVALSFFLTRTPCRVLTTSVDGSQLAGVLWGEIRRFIQTSRIPLERERGGPLVVNHLHIRKTINGGRDICGRSYLMGRVAARGEGMLGHHIEMTSDGIPRTLFIVDEASGVDDLSYERATTWARRVFVIGNPFACTTFFKKNVKAGDQLAPDGKSYYRKVIKIKATDSPNVRYALEEIRLGRKPSGRLLVPGVLPWGDYKFRLDNWDEPRKCVSLNAEFWEGADALLYPPDWLNKSEEFWTTTRHLARRAQAIGVDPAEGGDKTTYCVVDKWGVLKLLSKKTPNTTDIPKDILALMREYDVDAENVVLDRACGKPQADVLREQGHMVRTAAFGGSIEQELRHGRAPLSGRREFREEKYAYKDKRSQMYWMIREQLEPVDGKVFFGIPPDLHELRRQLAVIPLTRDREGRFELIPKKRAATATGAQSNLPTLVGLIGHSPDEADALALAVYGMLVKPLRTRAGAA